MTNNELMLFSHLTELVTDNNLHPHQLVYDTADSASEVQLRVWLDMYRSYSFVILPRQQFEKQADRTITKSDIGHYSGYGYYPIPQSYRDETNKSRTGVPIPKSYIEEILRYKIELRRGDK